MLAIDTSGKPALTCLSPKNKLRRDVASSLIFSHGGFIMVLCVIRPLKKNILASFIAMVALTGFYVTAYAALSKQTINNACTGTIVDNYYLKPSAASLAYSSLTDKDGNFFVAGSAYSSSDIDHWVVRKSTDGGLTWKTVDDYQYQPGALGYNDISPVLAQDSNGNLYAAGFSFDTLGNTHWIIRKSSDSGLTWNTVDDFKSSGSAAIATGFTSDINGNIYSVGYGSTKRTGYHWYVRKSDNAGLTWSIVDDFQFSPSTAAEAAAITSDSTGNLYASGSANNNWVVRKSTDSGITWSTVDSFQNDGNLAESQYIISDSKSYLYSVGTAYNTYPEGSKWVVRQSIDNGITWKTVDDFQFMPTQLAEARSVTVDTKGNVYVLGSAQDADGFHWITRKSIDDGGTWTTIDKFQLKGNKMASGNTIWTDANGNIFTAGMAGNRWIIRKLSCQ